MVFLHAMAFGYVIMRNEYLRTIVRGVGLGRGAHDEINESCYEQQTVK